MLLDEFIKKVFTKIAGIVIDTQIVYVYIKVAMTDIKVSKKFQLHNLVQINDPDSNINLIPS